MNQTKETPKQYSYQSPHDYQAGHAPGINVQHADSQSNHYSSPPGSAHPGALQAGRPSAGSTMTTPQSIPSLPPIQNPNQQASSSRPSTGNHSHSYSRSSPAGLDQQKYAPFPATPESSSKYSSTPTNRYAPSQPGQGDSLYSPLGLADIRSGIDSGLSDTMSANPYSSDAYPNVATNSNYLAPWPVYAFDWCKWPIQNQQRGNSAGKLAIGSYVEDGHNFVGLRHGTKIEHKG